jgi:O-antigen/teichoic acid export membrane protein
MGLTANKHVAELKRTDPARAGRILGLASATAWISSGVMAAALFASAPWLAAKTLAAPHLTGVLRIGAVLLFLSGLNGAQTGALSGFEAFKAIARINLISGVLTFPLMVLGAWRWGVAGAVWGLIGSQLANCLLCFVAVRAEAARFQIRYAFAGWRGEWKLFVGFSLPAVLTGVLNSVVAWGAGALVVNQAGGYGDMGIYNAALRVKLVPEALSAMLIAPILPILSEAFGKKDHVTFQRTLLFSFLLATLIIVPISLMQAAVPALTLLPFGPEYGERPTVVVWLMLHAVLYALMFPMGSILISMGEMWFSWLVNLLFAVTFGVAAWLLVPRYGASGYAASMVIGYGFACLPCVVFLHRKLPEVMRSLRWGVLTGTTLILFGLCAGVHQQWPSPWAAVVGLAAALAFVGLKYRLHASSLPKITS